MSIRREVIFSLAALALGTTGADAAPSPSISITHGWTRAAPKSGASAKGFFTLHNSGAADRLLSVTCPVAEKTTIRNEAGHAVSDLLLTSGETIVLTPKGPHLLLAHTHFPLYPRALIPCSAAFRDAGTVMLYLHVEPNGANSHKLAGGSGA